MHLLRIVSLPSFAFPLLEVDKASMAYFRVLFRIMKERKGRKKIETDDDKYTRWERDYDLVDFPVHGLYEEYLEMGECRAVIYR